MSKRIITKQKRTDGIFDLNVDSLTVNTEFSCGSQIETAQDFVSEGYQWRLGGADVFNLSSVAHTTALGCYQVASDGWTTAGTTHVIDPSLFLVETSRRNVIGQFRIVASSKSTSSSKQAILTADYFYTQGATVCEVSVISTTKATTTTMTTFTVAATASSGGVTVTTDSNMRVAWHFLGFI